MANAKKSILVENIRTFAKHAKLHLLIIPNL